MSLPIAVVGGSGLLGRAIVRALVRAGHDVTVLDISYCPELPAKFHRFDVTTDAWNTTSLQTAEVVVVAAGMLAAACNRAPRAAWELNVAATGQLIQELARARQAVRLVFLSSAMVYDDRFGPCFKESDPTRSTCLYSASKLAIEHLLAATTASTGMQALILRPFTVYGFEALSGERGHLFGRWLEAGGRGEPVTVFGDGSQVVDPVPVELVGEVCARFAEATMPIPLLTVNVTSGGSITVGRLAELFVDAGIARGARYVAAGDQRSRGWGDPTVLESFLGRPLARNPEREVSEFLHRLRAAE